MKKRIVLWAALAAALVLCAVLFMCLSGPKPGGTYDDLIQNGDFEQGDSGWLREAYVNTAGYTVYEVRQGEGRNGSTALYIRNDYLNDARFMQEVEVSPSTIYHLHGYIKASAQNGLGANLSVDGVYTFSDLVYDAADEWQEVSLYGITGEDQTTLKIFARLGGYSGESVGEAWFDDVSIRRVDAVPEGYLCQNLFAQKTNQADEAGIFRVDLFVHLLCTDAVHAEKRVGAAGGESASCRLVPGRHLPAGADCARCAGVACARLRCRRK